jgi:hypothetical protein
MTLDEFIKAGLAARQLATLIADTLNGDIGKLNSHDTTLLNERVSRLHTLTVAMKRENA